MCCVEKLLKIKWRKEQKKVQKVKKEQMMSPRVQKRIASSAKVHKIFARRARLIKGKCWREGTFVLVYICTTLRTIHEG